MIYIYIFRTTEVVNLPTISKLNELLFLVNQLFDLPVIYWNLLGSVSSRVSHTKLYLAAKTLERSQCSNSSFVAEPNLFSVKFDTELCEPTTISCVSVTLSAE